MQEIFHGSVGLGTHTSNTLDSSTSVTDSVVAPVHGRDFFCYSSENSSPHVQWKMRRSFTLR